MGIQPFSAVACGTKHILLSSPPHRDLVFMPTRSKYLSEACKGKRTACPELPYSFVFLILLFVAQVLFQCKPPMGVHCHTWADDTQAVMWPLSPAFGEAGKLCCFAGRHSHCGVWKGLAAGGFRAILLHPFDTTALKSLWKYFAESHYSF